MATRARGTARLFLAFAIGVAVIVAAVRYLSGIQQEVAGTHTAPSTERARSNEATSPTVAGRLSYELSAAPESREIVSEPRVPPAPATSAPAQQKGPPADIMPGEYVANVRPITAAPPDPRDRTPEIQKESARAQSIRANSKRPGIEKTP